MMRLKLIILMILLMQLLNAQRDKRSVPFSIRGVIGIPSPISSGQFKTAFKGSYEGNISVNARTFSTFFVGVGYQNTNFQNDKEIFAFVTTTASGAPAGQARAYNTSLVCHGAFFKLGYDQFFGKGYVSYSLNTGIMFCGYKNVVADSSAANAPFPPPEFNTPYVQPELAVHFLTDGPLAFSILFSYGTMFTKFDPKMPRFAQIDKVAEAKDDNDYVISWINIGFGFTILLGK